MELPRLTNVDIAGSKIKQLQNLPTGVTTLKLGSYTNDIMLSR
jgi:hypothetical protein